MARMKLADLPEYVEHMRTRFLADVLLSATADFWRFRAEAFEAAMPREGDYTGHATPEEIEAQRYSLAATALACRQRAVFMLGGEVD